MFFSEIKPYARYVRFLDIKTYTQLSREVTPLDNRLFYVCGGTGLFKIGGQILEAPAGSLLYIHSGISYAHLPCNAFYLAINFDFLQEKRHISSPVPPCEKGENKERTRKQTTGRYFTAPATPATGTEAGTESFRRKSQGFSSLCKAGTELSGRFSQKAAGKQPVSPAYSGILRSL